MGDWGKFMAGIWGGGGGAVLHGGLKTKGGGVSQIHFLVIILHFSNHEVTYT